MAEIAGLLRMLPQRRGGRLATAVLELADQSRTWQAEKDGCTKSDVGCFLGAVGLDGTGLRLSFAHTCG